MTITKTWKSALYLNTEDARQAYLVEALNDAKVDPTEVFSIVAKAK